MKQSITIISSLLLFAGVHVKSFAQGTTTITAAVPKLIETFDWSLGTGGNDGDFGIKDNFSLDGKRGNAEFLYCMEGNQCVRVGATHNGLVRVAGVRNDTAYMTLRAAPFKTKDNSNVKINFVTKSGKGKTQTIDAGKFSNIRRTIYGANDDGNYELTGVKEEPDFTFFVDDLVLYHKTSDVDEMKSATRLIVRGEKYTSKQIELLQEIVAENENLTSIDLWSLNNTSEKFELNPANPNCIIYDIRKQVTNTTNVVRSSKWEETTDLYVLLNSLVCNDLVIEDGYPFDAMYTFTARNVSYNREFAQTGENYFSTMCVPFTIAKDNDKISKLLKFTKLDKKNEQLVFDDANRIEANVPYVVSVKDKQPFMDLTNVNAEITATTARTTCETPAINADYDEIRASRKNTFSGTYSVRTDIASTAEKSIYGFSGGRFVKVDGGCTFNPFRAYVAIDNTNVAKPAKEMKIATKDGWVGITDAVIDANDGETVVCTTDGVILRREPSRAKALQNLPKGIYIINGKKEIVK